MYDQQRHDDENAELTPAQRELADALRGLTPAAPLGISRDRLLFEAGAAAARRSIVRWRAAAAVLVIGNAALMAVTLHSVAGGGNASVAQGPSVPAPSVTVVDRPATVENVARPASADERPLVTRAAWDTRWSPARLLTPPSAHTTPADTGYLSVRDAVLRGGLSALPASSTSPARREKPPSVNELLGT